MIKQILFIIYTVFVKIFAPKVKIRRSLIWGGSIACDKGNSLIIENATIKRTKITVGGSDNKVVLKSCQNNVSIICVGIGNEIILDECFIHNTSIVLRGNNCKVIIGKGTTINSADIMCMGRENQLKIGEECMLSSGIDIWNTDSHQITDMEGKAINDSKPVFIGNHVWVGKNVSILKGVNIGDNSVIGMGSIVTKDILPNTVNAGIPAKMIKNEINWDRKIVEK